MVRHLCLLFLSCALSFYSFSQNKRLSSIDTILNLREQSGDSDLNLEERVNLAKRALDISNEIEIDSTILLSKRNLSYLHLLNGNYERYKTLNFENLKLAYKLKDTTSLAAVNHNIGYYYDMNVMYDSSYYYYGKAVKFYEHLGDANGQSSVLINISNILRVEKDYIGSDETAIRAIKIIQTLPESERTLDDLWMLYTNLGANALRLNLLDESHQYHNQALEISGKMRDGFLNRFYSYNNIAFVHREKGEYDKALELYNSLIPRKSDYNEQDPTFYALIIDNIAYTKLLAGHQDYDVMEAKFKEAYKISDSLEDPITKLAVSIDLAKFYLEREQKDSSLAYAEKAYDLGKDMHSNDILLEAMMVLSKLKDGEEAKAYLNEHIKLSDSLLNVERNVRNKFARIEFETDKLQEENRRIVQERLWLTILSLGLLLTVILVYIIITQRAKNKALQFRQDQQKANEEIYNLMLSQQDKIEEARANEKKRISEELHDGVLGRLFGTRLSLDSLNFSEGQDAIKSRLNYINELKVIEEDIRKISHDLNTDFVSGSGFMDILSELIEKQARAYQLNYNFDFTDDINWERIPNKTKINIYRIVQESIQNIYKHAEANSVKISIQLKNHVILLRIEDDGKGFDVNKSKKGIGIKNINSRVSEIDGTANFDSKINQGTILNITVPYKPN